ncbi:MULTISPECIES: alpha/beta hydrolase [Azospirillum]|uniref:Alpha/beta hydrolase n=1 Tax=Azospirillum brasilense TaxID=192 RepID=A0A4D8QJP3_AZOBR|nr:MULTISPECIES: alpha/beta hydrolase [Azospirillum]MBF5093797.1 alpha/beta hydrolase [Azospirillum sp. INR13]QCO05842.1 alpha/beta hydrolase [Azospirillum argentinense]
MNIYRSFTQDQLDLEYNVRAGIPDHLDIFDRWKNDSEKFRQSANLHENLRYGADAAQSIDLFCSAGENAPIVVFIHGGYWQSLDKSDFSYIAKSYIEDGFNFAAVNYRLAPSVSMANIVSDVQNALLWLYRNAQTYRCDPGRIYVTGSSAGGHLTAMMMSTDWRSLSAPSDLVKGGCALSGLYDLEPIRLCYLNEKVRLDQNSAREFSPILRVPAAAAPLLISVGGGESSEFHRQQAVYVQAWREAGLTVQEIEQTDGHHFDMCDRLGDRREPLYQAVVGLIRSHGAA